MTPHLPDFEKKRLLVAFIYLFIFFFEARSAIQAEVNDPFCRFSIANTGSLYLLINFQENLTKKCDHESAASKKYKRVAMTSSISNFENQRKTDLASICQIICGNFRKNLIIRLGCRYTDRHKDAHTQTHTETLDSIPTY